MGNRQPGSPAVRRPGWPGAERGVRERLEEASHMNRMQQTTVCLVFLDSCGCDPTPRIHLRVEHPGWRSMAIETPPVKRDLVATTIVGLPAMPGWPAEGATTFWHPANVVGPIRLHCPNQLLQDPLSPLLDGRAVGKSRL